MAIVPPRIVELVETFDQHIEVYRSQQYNETQLRREFLDPFFEELGWDVTNKAGYAQTYKDVIHEDSIKVGGATKAPDYCFRIGGIRKFFLEAKKPSVDIKGDPHPAYQLRRYAWSARLPLSILTDFEEFAVYDCLVRPKQTDRADTARIMFLTYKDYLKDWSKIADIFSKEAILKGSFDKFAASAKGKRGTSTVDKEFLAEIEKWRNMLARIIALRNRSLSVKEINFAVQRTIDRVLFLRMCEDRGIEDYGQLLKTSSGDRTYPRLCEIFEKADQKYNSGLFHFHDEPGHAEGPDELTQNIIIDDKDLKWILHSLYYPQSPYEFSVLPAEILGNVYEQFLGKVITLTTNHRANVEDKPEVKKAGGVYYTPSYIVDYIVKNTVGKLCEGKTPRAVSNLRILDPACGSGSFLIGAFQYLLDWHLKYYTDNDPEKHLKGKNPKIYQAPTYAEVRPESNTPNYKLTVAEKKRILLNNIYGVDIDSQAVEVTKLSLLLKVLEGENQQTIENQYRLFHERALPDLATNIKCGNSLIGPDFFDSSCHSRENGNPQDLHDQINPFNWQDEFPEIFNRKNPGFDAVIGNPPYLAGRVWTDTLRFQRSYFTSSFSCLTDQYDLYALFIQKGIDLLTSKGLFSFITPNTWLNNKHYLSLRKWLLQKTNVLALADFRDVKVFSGATVLPVIIVLARTSRHLEHLKIPVDRYLNETTSQRHFTSTDTWQEFSDLVFNLSLSQRDLAILRKIEESSVHLSKCATVRFGVKVYQRGKGNPVQTGEEAPLRIFESTTKVSHEYYPYIRGKYVTRWHIDSCRAWLKYGPHLAEPRSFDLFTGERILVRRIVGRRFTVVPTSLTLIADQLLHTVTPLQQVPGYHYIAGLLASRLIAYFFHNRFNRTEKTFPEVRVGELEQIPIRRINFGDPTDKAKHDKIVNLVQGILDLHMQLADAKIPDDKTRLQRQIAATDKQIDKLVYRLYGLSEEEIKIVEVAT